ncbi:TPA: DUF1700 domain-containing protein [Enterococcus faecalis]|uniref:HAAS signaling domain-containing protein n=1 Tax=Lactobacillales TaxID=186826 RepID=UPI0018E1D7B4|nr:MULTISPECIES: DUF1700 domain-containing protein [Lactobacillales]MBW7791403.1 DUF1700 domain-containing protein [Enterococcus faecalis]HBC4274690.1 DUF1700 domain-containing protein [Enterococcus faecalis]HBC4445115.1 DUF1700 domain-containing protein [Enterococcus faecalis]HBC9167108.1 DUF1700 domain-containing protein [Enterococcus faecalis]
MRDIKISNDLEKYLSQVDRYLKYIPVSEKTDILSELKSSFYERLKNGQSSEEVLAKMPSAKDLAENYIDDSFVKTKKFTFKKLCEYILFYSYSSLIWLAVIPTLFSLAIGFLLSGIISFAAGLMGLLKGLVNISFLNEIKIIFIYHELKGVSALLVGILLAIVFAILGILFWRGTVALIRHLQNKKINIYTKNLV